MTSGSQGVRTELAWERSGLGLLAASAALLFRPVAPVLGRLLLALVYLALALLVIALGRRRRRQLRALRDDGDGHVTVPEPRREVVWIGSAVLVTALATAVLLALQG